MEVQIEAQGRRMAMLRYALGSCLMQAGCQGAFGVIPAHVNELSPASVRSLFPGFIYQLGVLVASPATIIELKLRDHVGYSWALTYFEGSVILVLLFLFWFGPEAHGKDFFEPVAGPPRSIGE